jgi:UDP-glucose 4-epimerase
MTPDSHQVRCGGSSARYTVLGARGFIGNRLVKMLNALSFECFVPARGEREIFNRDLGRVFYCIGLTADYSDRAFDTVEAHVTFLAEVLKKAEFESLVYLSSTRLYDSLPVCICNENASLVLEPWSRRHIYDLSKALGENLCMTTSKGRASVARLSCVYDSAPGSPGFLSEVMDSMRKRREFTLDSLSGIVRDYVFIDDVLIALKLILDTGRSEIFNVASGENVSNQDIVDTLNAGGYRVFLQHQSEREHTAICDIGKLRSLGVKPILVRDYLQLFLGNFEALNAAC